MKQGFQEPDVSLRNWSGSIGLDFTFVSRKGVSLVESHSEYTGGAHGNYYLRGRTFVEAEGAVQELKLPDLFDPASDWERRLVELCITDLRKQGASWIVEDPFDSKLTERFSKDDLASFTLSAYGIRFYFSPYHVGPYAEGIFTVFVPYSVIVDFLSKEGPARHFVSQEFDSGVNELN